MQNENERNHEEDNKRKEKDMKTTIKFVLCLHFLFYTVFCKVLVKNKAKFEALHLPGCLKGVKAIGEPFSGWRKGGHSCLIKVASK